MDLLVRETAMPKYNLKRNPFPNVGIPEDCICVYTDRKKELGIIEDAIRGTLRGSSSHVVIVGSYGNGKTATLKFVQGEIEQQLPNGLALYLSNPGESFIDFYSNLMYEIGLERLEHFVWAYLEHVNKIKNLKEKVGKGDVLFSQILEAGKRHLYKDLRYVDFATAFLQLTLEQNKLLSWRYLCGELILFDQRRELNVVALIDSDEKALRAFMALKSILDSIGYQIICILVDELEFIEILHPFKKQRILNSIRRLIDLNPSGLCLILACAPEAWSSMIRDYHAFSERIFRELVLKPLSQEVIRDFIIAYLDRYRINSNQKNAIHPFSEDAIKETLIAAQGNLRRVLMICNRAIDRGRKASFPLLASTKVKQLMPEVFRRE